MIINIRNKITQSLKLFKRDDRGVAAIEFAYIAPLLIVLWLGTIELSLAVSIDRKVSRIASTVADLLTQVDIIDEAGVQDIMRVSEDIMFPYDARPNIVVSTVVIEDGRPRVEESRTNNGGPGHTPGSEIAVPEQINIDGSFLVVAEVTVNHTPIVGLFSLNGLTGIEKDTASFLLSDRLFLRPRRGNVCFESAPGSCS